MKSVVSLFAVLMTGHALAHEIEDNRATLVLRDGVFLSVTLHIAYPEALHRAIAPQRTFDEFALAFSAMEAGEMQALLARAQAKFEAGLQIQLPSGSTVALKNYAWPDQKTIQAAFQRRVMQTITGGHAHSDPLEIRAEGIAGSPVTSVQIQFPTEFGRVLVVAFKPTQLWVESNAISSPIRF